MFFNSIKDAITTLHHRLERHAERIQCNRDRIGELQKEIHDLEEFAGQCVRMLRPKPAHLVGEDVYLMVDYAQYHKGDKFRIAEITSSPRSLQHTYKVLPDVGHKIHTNIPEQFLTEHSL